MISLNHLSFWYEKTPVLSDITLTIKEKELVGLIGANGSGKTTLIKQLNGLLLPLKGSVEVTASQHPDQGSTA